MADKLAKAAAVAAKRGAQRIYFPNRVIQFMSNQESAELTLSSLRRRLATMRGCVVRAAAHACACVRVCEQLIDSVSKDYPASHHSVTDILVIAINVMQC